MPNNLSATPGASDKIDFKFSADMPKFEAISCILVWSALVVPPPPAVTSVLAPATLLILLTNLVGSVNWLIRLFIICCSFLPVSADVARVLPTICVARCTLANVSEDKPASPNALVIPVTPAWLIPLESKDVSNAFNI